MGKLLRSWIPDTSCEVQAMTDICHIYDAGDFSGILLEKNGKKTWFGYHVLERKRTSVGIEEQLESVHEFLVPKHFFSIETYPAKIDSSFTLWIPQWKIQTSRQQDFQQQQQLRQPQQPHESVAQQKQVTPRPSGPRPQPNRQPQPSVQPSQEHHPPSSQRPQKLSSGRPKPSQPSSQNKSNTEGKQTASPSSSRTSHGTPKQSTPMKQAMSLSLSSPNDHIAQQSQWYPLSQLSLSAPPLVSNEEQHPRQASSSQLHSNSKEHLPSQRGRRQRANKSQHQQQAS